MFMKNRILISMILGATSLSFVGCGDTTDNPNDFSMCDEIGYTDSATDNNLNALSENPTITLYGDRIITVPVGTTSILDNGDSVEASDPQDGDLKNEIQRSDDVNLNQAGEYHIKYTVEDSDGNQDTKCRKVIVEGNNTEVNGLYGDYTSDDTTNNDGYVDGYTGGEQNNNDLGTPLGGDDSTGYNNYSSDLDTFISWYDNTCGGTFNSSLYNESTRTYNGKIDCSNKGLRTIDLSPLSMFDGINEIDLSKNKLTDIDFSPIKNLHTLYNLNIAYNTSTLKKKYDTVEERNALYRYFPYLHGGKKDTDLFIGFKPRSGNKEDLLSIKF